MTHRLDRMSRTKDASGIKEVYIKRDQRDSQLNRNVKRRHRNLEGPEFRTQFK